MKNVSAIPAVLIIIFQLSAAETQNIDAFARFTDASAQADILADDAQNTAWGENEVDALINEWKNADIRKKSIDLLARNGFDITSNKNTVVIEWGGGGVSYQALYIAEKGFLVKTQDKNISVEEITINETLSQTVATLQKMLKNDNYPGDISGNGCDFITCIITAFDDTTANTAIIYSAAASDQTNTNTVEALKLISEIKEACKINNSNGA